MKAAILAAGEGIRLRPITLTRPKHMISVGGKPILEHCLATLGDCGFNEVNIVVRYMQDFVRGYFGDGGRLRFEINYVEQEKVVGTGNAVSSVEPYVEDPFLLVYGDLLFTSAAITKVLRLHNENKPVASMAVVPVENPEEYGIVELEDGKVKRLVEKPSREEAPTNLANAGIYVLSTEIFEKVRRISASARGELEVTDAISAMLKDGERVEAVEISNNDWFDIGRPWDLLEANRWVLTRMRHEVLGQVETGAHILGRVSVAETARIRSGTYIEGPAFIDEESDIGPNCYIRPYTSVGREVRIGNACEIKNSLLFNKVHIGHLSYLGDSVVGEECNLGAGTTVANFRLDGKNVRMMVKDTAMDSGRRKLGVVLGDHVKTGINALLMPGVKVGCNSWVGPNVVVDRDLEASTAVFVRQETERRGLAS